MTWYTWGHDKIATTGPSPTEPIPELDEFLQLFQFKFHRRESRAAAERLSRLMAPALPTVAGTWVTPDAKIMAQAMKVARVTNGTVDVPDGWWPVS